MIVDATGIFLMRQFFLQVPVSLEEAGKVDGASIGRILVEHRAAGGQARADHSDDPVVPGLVERVPVLRDRYHFPEVLHPDNWPGQYRRRRAVGRDPVPVEAGCICLDDPAHSDPVLRIAAVHNARADLGRRQGVSPWTGTSCKRTDLASLVCMELLRWERRPSLRQPALVAAFEGWNDAGNAASEAAAYLERAWGGSKFAVFDSEELFDFTSTRPQVRLESGETRRLEWPSISLSSASPTWHGPGRDLLVGARTSAPLAQLCRGSTPGLRGARDQAGRAARRPAG